jgi:hypothetical protein
MYRMIAVSNSRMKLTKEHNEVNTRPRQFVLPIYITLLQIQGHVILW